VAIEHHRLTKAGGSWISLGVGLSAARTGWGGRSCVYYSKSIYTTLIKFGSINLRSDLYVK
jgi:hypothetical protein